MEKKENKFKKYLEQGKTVIIIILLSALSIVSNRPYKVPDNKVLIDTITMDSLTNLVPDTIYEDTIIYATKWKRVTDTIEKLVPVIVNDTTYVYTDSLEDDNIKIAFKGTLSTSNFNLDPTYDYFLKVPKIVEKTIKTSYPVYIKEPEKPKTTIWAVPTIGIGNQALVGGGLYVKNKKDNLFGINYSRLGNQNIYQVSVGLKIK